MKTIKSLTILMMVCISQTTYSQILWSYHYGSNNDDNVSTITTDNANNVYTSGSFKGNSLIFNTTSIPVDGYNDIYLAKFDAAGNSLWAKRFGGYNSSLNTEGTCGHFFDKYSNNIILPGVFDSYLFIGTDTFNSVNGNCFLAKLDTGGNVLWAKQFKVGFANVITDSLGNIYVWGTIKTATVMDTIPLQPGVYMAKMNSNGNVLWAKKMFNVYGFGNGLLKVTPKGMKIYNNEIYLTADTKGDTIMIDTINYPQTYINSAALMKFTNDGNLIWMKTIGPNAIAQNIGIDFQGNCYLPGGFKGTIHFDGDSISSQGATINDGFYCKYDSMGHFQWVQQLHATAGAGFGNLSINEDGNAYIIARMLGSAMFGNFNVTSLGTMSAIDNYVARYNSSGNCLGVTQVGITTSGGFGYIAQDNSNNALTVGDYQNSITLGGATYSTYGNNDIAIAKLAVITGIGGNERHANNQLVIYANPTAGKCNITVPVDFLHEKNLTLSIYANNGKLIQQKTITLTDDKIRINLEAEAKGIYNVTLSNGVKFYSGKIVFE